jgi:hypothetical protein
VLDQVGMGSFLPVQSLYVLRDNSEVWEAVFDVAFSVLGMFWSPLWFSFHVWKLLKLPAATIVVDSIVTNYR